MSRKSVSRCLLQLLAGLLLGVLMMLLSCLFSSCRSIRFIPVESIKERIEYRDRVERDSIHVLDSVYVKIKGDTVYSDRWRVVYKDRLIHDTAYICKTDSIQVPYPVEKPLNRWERLKIGLGGWAMGGLCLLMIVAGWRFCR